MFAGESTLIRGVLDLAHSLQRQTSTKITTNPNPKPRAPPRSWTLPPITDITNELHEIGLPTQIAAQFSREYVHYIGKVRSAAERSMRRSYTMLPPGSHTPEENLFQMWLSTYNRSVKACLDNTLALAQRRLTEVEHRSGCTSHKVRGNNARFKREYTPVLEEYFEQNAYPSTQDRASLAHKTMMTERQIEVWFQNHRTRAKKFGKVLHRSIEPLIHEFDMYDSMGDTDDTSSDETSSDCFAGPFVRPIIPSSLASNPLLGASAPSHAFPAPYPPKCDYDPFPARSSTDRFPAPLWERRAMTFFTPDISVDIDDLTSSFARKLVLQDDSSTKYQSRRSQRTRLDRLPTSYTIPPSAPIPALIRVQLPRLSTNSTTPYSRRASSEITDSFRSASLREIRQESQCWLRRILNSTLTKDVVSTPLLPIHSKITNRSAYAYACCSTNGRSLDSVRSF